VAELQAMGWSVSDAADTGLSTTVMLNEEMIGASVDMNSYYLAASDPKEHSLGAQPSLRVFAFSLTTENPITITPGTVVRSGSPLVTVEHHHGLNLAGCSADVDTSVTPEQVVATTVAALAATVEQFHLLTA
jgi:hypothetical protein